MLFLFLKSQSALSESAPISLKNEYMTDSCLANKS